MEEVILVFLAKPTNHCAKFHALVQPVTNFWFRKVT